MRKIKQFCTFLIHHFIATITLFGYISLHFNFMYWSVIGLYGAFLAEILTRIPPLVIQDRNILPLFFGMVGVAIFIVMGLGFYFMSKKRKDWSKFERLGS